MELECKIQHYEWGKLGASSAVAQLYTNTNPNHVINVNLPYAELWMGTHVNGPSSLKSSGQLLSAVIAAHPEYLGDKVVDKFGAHQLPFLFKVLSVNKALSIQAHPSKKHAEALHATYPDIYKDSNHKPEMAVAITPFEALCGFRPLEQFEAFIESVPELKHLIGDEILEKYRNSLDGLEFLKSSFKAVLTSTKEAIKTQLESLLDRISTLGTKDRESNLADLLERLYSQFPNDVGCFMIYFLNYLKLQPLETLYLGANVPHAYISGDCIECMSCSDNVVRAGLTPKFIDVETLCSMLIYHQDDDKSDKERHLKATEEDKYCKIYRPPVPDFAVVQIQLPVEVNNYEIKPRTTASILLVVKGKGEYLTGNLVSGTTIFLSANGNFQIVNVSEDLLIYQALANV